MLPIAQRLMTAEEYLHSPLNSKYSELVRGQVVETLPHGVRARIRDFAGTSLVWIVHPGSREVVAHTPDGLAHTYSEDDVLERVMNIRSHGG